MEKQYFLLTKTVLQALLPFSFAFRNDAVDVYHEVINLILIINREKIKRKEIKNEGADSQNAS